MTTKTKRALNEGPLFSFAASLGERISLQPVRSRLAPQERCAQLSCASKPGGFMQPSGAPGAHKLLVRPRNARCKRKEQKIASRCISRILSGLTCGFLRRRSGLRVFVRISRPASPPLPAQAQKNGPPGIPGGPVKIKSRENYLIKR